MSYTQRQILGYSISDFPAAIMERHVSAYVGVDKGFPITVRYMGLFALVPETKPLRVRQVGGYVISKSPSVGQIRQVVAYALAKNPAVGQIRQISAYALIVNAVPVVKNKTGLLALYDLINNNSKSITFSPSNLSIAPPQVVTGSDKNTSIVIAPIGKYGYGGHGTLYYNRITIVRMFDTTALTFSINSDTTLRALIPQINTSYGLSLVASDLVDYDVYAGATGLRLIAAPSSYMLLPDTFVALGVDPGPPQPSLSSRLSVRIMDGYSEFD